MFKAVSIFYSFFHQVVFEGVRGNGYASDMAIDDVKMLPSCPPPGMAFLQLFACWVILHVWLTSADIFSTKLSVFKNSFWSTIRVSNSLDPDQDRHSVGPDLDPNCLQGLLADGKSCPWQ